MTSSTTSGFESMGTWLEVTSIVAAFMRFAAKRCSSGLTVRSWLATMYQLGLVCRAFDLLVEQVRHRHALRRVDEVLFRLRQVSGKAADAARLQPYSPVRHVDVLEHIGLREFVLLALQRLRRQRYRRRRGFAPDEVGALLGDHHGCRVGVGRRHAGHHRSVNHAQVLQAVDPKLVADHA
jgi:hypothetical protein